MGALGKKVEFMAYRCIYFGIKELVSPIVYNKWKEQAWMFFDENVLQDLDKIRETYGSPIIINNWATGLKQCGLRSNMDEMVKNKKTLYLSAHCLAKGFDLHCVYGHNNKLWQHCYNLIKSKKLKAFKRLEDIKNTNGWTHIDAFQSDNIVF